MLKKTETEETIGFFATLNFNWGRGAGPPALPPPLATPILQVRKIEKVFANFPRGFRGFPKKFQLFKK